MQVRRADLQGDDPLLGFVIGPDEADLGLIVGRRAVRRVVHLQNDIRAGGNLARHARPADAGRLTGRIDRKYVGLGWTALPRIARLANIRDRVMNDGAHSRPDLDGLDTAILCEMERNDDVLVIDLVARRNVNRLRHAKNQVRLANCPKVRPDDWCRSIAFVAGRRARINPFAHCSDLSLVEPGIVLELNRRGLGEPWRHAPAEHLLADTLRPGTGLRVCEQRHRADLSGAVAGLTVPLEDRKHVGVERRCVRGREEKENEGFSPEASYQETPAACDSGSDAATSAEPSLQSGGCARA